MLGTETDHGCPCLTPNGIYFDTRRARLLTAVEQCALQCVRFDPSTLNDFSWSFLADLAGNSFNGGVISAIVIALLTVYAKRWADEHPLPSPDVAADTSDGVDNDIDDDALLAEGLTAHDASMEQCDDFLAQAFD